MMQNPIYIYKMPEKNKSKIVESGIVHLPWVIVTPPYIYLNDKKIWTKNKWKRFLYWIWNITKFKFILKGYQKPSKTKKTKEIPEPFCIYYKKIKIDGR
jgi:hypothetical protein